MKVVSLKRKTIAIICDSAKQEACNGVKKRGEFTSSEFVYRCKMPLHVNSLRKKKNKAVSFFFDKKCDIFTFIKIYDYESNRRRNYSCAAND